MSIRWQHCIDHADTKQNPANVTRLFSRRSSAADRQSVKRDYARPVLATLAPSTRCQSNAKRWTGCERTAALGLVLGTDTCDSSWTVAKHQKLYRHCRVDIFPGLK